MRPVGAKNGPVLPATLVAANSHHTPVKPPPSSGEDIFVHQSGIVMDGFRSLADGEQVEYTLQTDNDGRVRAVDVTGPNGARPQGAPRSPPRTSRRTRLCWSTTLYHDPHQPIHNAHHTGNAMYATAPPAVAMPARRFAALPPVLRSTRMPLVRTAMPAAPRAALSVLRML